MRATIWLLFGLLLPVAANADTSAADLKAIGQAAAAANGVPWNVFDAQIQGESGWNPNIGCNKVGACGIAQFIGPTAKSFSLDTSDPVASLYAAAKYDAQLYAKAGSWSGALSKYTGGLTPTSPGNNAYATAFNAASADDAAGLTPASILAGSGLPNVTLGNGSLPLTPDAAAVVDPTATGGTAAVGALGCAHQWLWDQLTNNTTPTINHGITNMETMVSGVIGALLLLALAHQGLTGALRNAPASDFIGFFVKSGIIVSFVAIGSPYYTTFVAGPIQTLPVWWQKYLVGSGAPSASPVAIFCWVDNQAWATSTAIENSLPWYAIGKGMLVDLAYALVWLSLWAMFWAKAGMTQFANIAAVVGPIPIGCGLFPRTEPMMWGWVAVVVTALLSLFGIDLALSIYGPLMLQVMSALTVTEKSLWGAAFAMAAMGASVVFLPMMWSKIGGGVTIGLGHAKRFLSGEIAAEAAGAATVAGAGLGAAAVGGGAVAAASVSRLTAAVGSSLSKGL